MNRYRASALIVLGCLVSQFAAAQFATETGVDAEEHTETAQDQTVALVIDFGDGFEERYTALPFRNEMTILDLLNAAKDHSRSLPFAFRGKGETAFLTSLDNVGNQGREGRNWIYYVNGQIGEQSFAITKIQAGDRVAWRLETYEQNR
jgi:hypothetical protein